MFYLRNKDTTLINEIFKLFRKSLFRIKTQLIIQSYSENAIETTEIYTYITNIGKSENQYPYLSFQSLRRCLRISSSRALLPGS